MRLRILADDLTGALDCAAAFGAGVAVHLGQPGLAAPQALDIVATATRDVPAADLPALLAPSLSWLRGADLAFKKIDSLLRGNTFDEVDWLARQGRFAGLVMAPAFPAQGRVTQGGCQWWVRADGTRTPVGEPIVQALQARGWQVAVGSQPPALDGRAPVAWLPDVANEAAMQSVAAFAAQGVGGWLWCGSAGLAQALAGSLPPYALACESAAATDGPVMLVSASHHPVSREQWRVLAGSPRGGACHRGDDPASLAHPLRDYPGLIDLSAPEVLTPAEAASLLALQAEAIAAHAPRPRTLVVVGGDTFLALCHALGARGLRSGQPLARPGWGCAHLVGGRWDGLACHTRSGAFGTPTDLVEVLDALQAREAQRS